MNWLFNTLWSSIGKKLFMALTGLCFCGFLTTHLIGNLTLYAGKDAFNSYAEHLHSLGPIIPIAEMGLLLLFVIHVLTGLTLFYKNFRARPTRYAVNKNAGGRTIASFTMPYTGVILFSFILFHLLQLHFIDKTGTTIYEIVSDTFSQKSNVAIYCIVMIFVGLHVSHGFWSAFQTLGADHVKYTPFIKKLSLLLSIIFGVGFGLIPIYISSIL
ncbi:MAG: succinate dehydrogenase cytochrome b subunit [Desulfobacterales bacterium]|jgi:succinate dehydrogenase / fumarate reductase, cytochrome b subunit|nr:succinate dehydrogenase cytochrome b subunit [Desulfobacteraceae bacterium]MBT7085106.1 succinate dehydrogenase cytochrome b subunit [Desulfobacterales bacterium]MBT7697747.1 succinate dehydrogenase cytochrome b subunit [Desulfobacterales bacterium]